MAPSVESDESRRRCINLFRRDNGQRNGEKKKKKKKEAQMHANQEWCAFIYHSILEVLHVKTVATILH